MKSKMDFIVLKIDCCHSTACGFPSLLTDSLVKGYDSELPLADLESCSSTFKLMHAHLAVRAE